MAMDPLGANGRQAAAFLFPSSTPSASSSNAGGVQLGSDGATSSGTRPGDVSLSLDTFNKSPYAPLGEVYYSAEERKAQLSTAGAASQTDMSYVSPTVDGAKILAYAEIFGRELTPAVMTRCKRSVKKLEWLLCLNVVPPAFFAKHKLAESTTSAAGGAESNTTASSTASPSSPNNKTVTTNLWLERLRKLRAEYAVIKEQYKIDLTTTLKRAQKNPTKFNPLSKAEDNPWEQASEDEELMQEISKDVERTYSDRELFCRKEVRSVLQQVLYNWCKQFNPSKKAAESYRQGMNELCAIAYQVTHDSLFCDSSTPAAPTSPRSSSTMLAFLHEFGSAEHREADCFILFRALMAHGFTPLFEVQAPVYTTKAVASPRGPLELPFEEPHKPPQVEVENPKTVILGKCNHIMETLLKKAEPELHRLLVETYCVPAQVFLLRWIRLLFCREFSVEDSLDLWAEIFQDSFLNGEKHDFELGSYIAVAMLRYVKTELLSSDESGCLSRLMKYPQVDVEPLMKMAKHIRYEVDTTKKHSVGLQILPQAYLAATPKSTPDSLSSTPNLATAPPQQTLGGITPAGGAHPMATTPTPLFGGALTVSTATATPASAATPLFPTPATSAQPKPNPLAGPLQPREPSTVHISSIQGPLFPPRTAAVAPAMVGAVNPQHLQQPLSSSGGVVPPPSMAVSGGAGSSVNWEEQFALLKEKARVKVNELNEKIQSLNQSLQEQGAQAAAAQREKKLAQRTVEDLTLNKDQSAQQISQLRTQISKLQNKQLFESVKKTNSLFGEDDDEQLAAAANLGASGDVSAAATDLASALESEIQPWRKRVDNLVEEKRQAEDQRDALEEERRQMIAGVEHLKTQAKARIQDLNAKLQEAQQKLQEASVGSATASSSAGNEVNKENEALAELKAAHAKELETMRAASAAKLEVLERKVKEAASAASADEKLRHEIEAKFTVRCAEVAAEGKGSAGGTTTASTSSDVAETSSAPKSPTAAPEGPSTDLLNGSSSAAAQAGASAAKQESAGRVGELELQVASLEKRVAELQQELESSAEQARTAKDTLQKQAIAKMTEMKTAYETALGTARAQVTQETERVAATQQQLQKLQLELEKVQADLAATRTQAQSSNEQAQTQAQQAEAALAAEKKRNEEALTTLRSTLEKDIVAATESKTNAEQALQAAKEAADVAEHNMRVEAEEQTRLVREQKDKEIEDIKNMAREKIAELTQQNQDLTASASSRGDTGQPAEGEGSSAAEVAAVREEYEATLDDFRKQARDRFAAMTETEQQLRGEMEALQAKETESASKSSAYEAEIQRLQGEIDSLANRTRQLEAELRERDNNSRGHSSAEFEIVKKDELLIDTGTTAAPAAVLPGEQDPFLVDTTAPAGEQTSKSTTSNTEIDKLFDEMDM
ncbi:unnamed protein product [Amoebophrya sp. A25]|nr:unnamed protein product [Amoebophrya sp. A25]|eukprot:GSA25T00014307001.1